MLAVSRNQTIPLPPIMYLAYILCSQPPPSSFSLPLSLIVKHNLFDVFLFLFVFLKHNVGSSPMTGSASLKALCDGLTMLQNRGLNVLEAQRLPHIHFAHAIALNPKATNFVTLVEDQISR